MKFSTTTENLKKGLATVSHIVGKNQNLPILNNVLINTQGNILFLSTTNLEVGIKSSVRGKTEKDGGVTVPAKLLNDYINNLSSETVNLESDKLNLEIKAKGSHTIIKGTDPAEFPLLPDIETDLLVEIPVKTMKNSLQQTVFASSNDTTRPELCSVLAKIKNKILYLVATDSYRLAEKKININTSEDLSVLIPQTTLQEVNRVFGDSEDEELKVEFNENQIKFSDSKTFLISRISEGQFPDYEQIIPKNGNCKSIVDINGLTKAIRAVSIFCRQGINDIKMIFLDKSVVITAINDLVGESKVEIEAKTTGQKKEIVFNYHYLLDVLSAVGGGQIEIAVSENNLPGLIKPVGNDDYVYVIMPIKQ